MVCENMKFILSNVVEFDQRQVDEIDKIFDGIGDTPLGKECVETLYLLQCENFCMSIASIIEKMVLLQFKKFTVDNMKYKFKLNFKGVYLESILFSLFEITNCIKHSGIITRIRNTRDLQEALKKLLTKLVFTDFEESIYDILFLTCPEIFLENYRHKYPLDEEDYKILFTEIDISNSILKDYEKIVWTGSILPDSFYKGLCSYVA